MTLSNKYAEMHIWEGLYFALRHSIILEFPSWNFTPSISLSAQYYFARATRKTSSGNPFCYLSCRCIWQCRNCKLRNTWSELWKGSICMREGLMKDLGLLSPFTIEWYQDPFNWSFAWAALSYPWNLAGREWRLGSPLGWSGSCCPIAHYGLCCLCCRRFPF